MRIGYEDGSKLESIDEAAQNESRSRLGAKYPLTQSRHGEACLSGGGGLLERKASLAANENGDLDLLEGKAEADENQIMKVYGSLEKYFPSWVGYNMAKCGGCIRACVSMLEAKGGCMEGRFKEPLRTGKAWKLDA